jgi:RNase P/RNase MRP subunit POP5
MKQRCANETETNTGFRRFKWPTVIIAVRTNQTKAKKMALAIAVLVNVNLQFGTITVRSSGTVKNAKSLLIERIAKVGTH